MVLPAEASVSVRAEDRRPRASRLAPDEAARALYVDFEGRIGKPPILLGCARRPGRGAVPWVWQALLDPLFDPLAEADGLPMLSIADAIERIVMRAEAHDVPIVAWSEHELRVVRAHCEPVLVERFERRFVNARKVASRWTGRLPADARPPSKRLADYLTFIGHDVPDGAGLDVAADAIRVLTGALERGRGATGLTIVQRRHWTRLRDHNRHDCDGMRDVCIRAARELEAADRSRVRPPRRRRRRHRRARAPLDLIGVR
jgi:hypothetical protein